MSPARLSIIRPASGRASRTTWRAYGTGALILATLSSAGFAAPASAATWTGSASDPVGDAPAPGRDLVDVSYRSNSRGSIRVVLTMAGPIDGAAADAAIGISVGSSCSRVVLSGGGVLSEPDPVFFAKVAGTTIGKDREGRGVVSGATYTLSVKHSSFKALRPKCLTVVVVDPATSGADAPVIFDQLTDLRIKRK